MSTITVFPNDSRASPVSFRAVSGDKHATGSTVGQALDTLQAELGTLPETTLVIVQPMAPDDLFTAEQRTRLAALMTRWRIARDAGTSFPPEEERELDSLIQFELRAAGERAARLLRSAPK